MCLNPSEYFYTVETHASFVGQLDRMIAGLAIWQTIEGHPLIIPVVFAEKGRASHCTGAGAAMTAAQMSNRFGFIAEKSTSPSR